MPHARLYPTPCIKTCLYKVRAHQEHHKHFCNSSPPTANPTTANPRASRRLLAMVKSPIDRVKWQRRCQEWQRDDDFKLEVDWTTSTWWKPNWWTIEDRYKHTILARLGRQLANERNKDPLQVHWKCIWYEDTADEYTMEFIMDFGAITNWDVKTESVRHIRVSYEALKNTTRYQ